MVLIEDITEAELAREAAEAAAKKAAEEEEAARQAAAAAAEAQAEAARQATSAAAAAGSEEARAGAGAPNEGGEVAGADSQPPAELTEEEKVGHGKHPGSGLVGSGYTSKIACYTRGHPPTPPRPLVVPDRRPPAGAAGPGRGAEAGGQRAVCTRPGSSGASECAARAARGVSNSSSSSSSNGSKRCRFRGPAMSTQASRC